MSAFLKKMRRFTWSKGEQEKKERDDYCIWQRNLFSPKIRAILKLPLTEGVCVFFHSVFSFLWMASVPLKLYTNTCKLFTNAKSL